MISEGQWKRWKFHSTTDDHLRTYVLSDIRQMLGEIERLRAENVRLIEDRARFPDRPDDIGRMIHAHYENLKHGKDSADRHANNAMNRSALAAADCQELIAATEFLTFYKDDPERPSDKMTGARVTFGELRRVVSARAKLTSHMRTEK